MPALSFWSYSKANATSSLIYITGSAPQETELLGLGKDQYRDKIIINNSCPVAVALDREFQAANKLAKKKILYQYPEQNRGIK